MNNINNNNNKYLGQLAILNNLKNTNFVSEKEYIKMKKFLMNKYNVKDILAA